MTESFRARAALASRTAIPNASLGPNSTRESTLSEASNVKVSDIHFQVDPEVERALNAEAETIEQRLRKR